MGNVGGAELVVLLVLLAGVAMVVVGRAAGRNRPAARPLSEITVPADLQARIRALDGDGKRILAIKELRAATGLSLVDAKTAVESIAAGAALPTPPRTGPGPRGDLAYRARVLLGEGREPDAVRLVTTETGMSGPEAAAFVRSLQP